MDTKSEGGFTLKFQDFPHSDTSGFTDIEMPNSAHSDLENEFDAFLKSQYDTDNAYDIELDFMNDDDWSQVNAVWNIKDNNNDNLQQQKQENVGAHPQHRRLYNSDDEFLSGLLGHRRRRRRHHRRRHRGHYQQQNPMGMMSPMQSMMMKMMTMKMYMQMMHTMMNKMGGNGNGGCTPKCSLAQLQYFNQLNEYFEQDKAEYSAIQQDYDNLLNEYYSRRRLREERRRKK